MTNKDFLQHINAHIYKSNNRYYVAIPFSEYDESKTYIKNWNSFSFIELNDSFLSEEYTHSFLTTELNDYEDIYSTNYEYFSAINKLNDLYSEVNDEHIKTFYKTFANVILAYAYVTDISPLTEIYTKTLEFFANGKTDSTLVNLKLLLESNSYSISDTNEYSNCGCNTNKSSMNSLENLNCSDKYLQSILLYCSQMFGDLNFYNNFFFIDNDEPNEDMIDLLINLLNTLLEILNSNNQLSVNQKTSHCQCPEMETNDTNTISIISNYIKVLSWVKNCEIEENTNKIKLYGTQFGEIFPNLYFA